jgi:hypothetical protein
MDHGSGGWIVIIPWLNGEVTDDPATQASNADSGMAR